jgi:hypothetical protein
LRRYRGQLVNRQSVRRKWKSEEKLSSTQLDKGAVSTSITTTTGADRKQKQRASRLRCSGRRSKSLAVHVQLSVTRLRSAADVSLVIGTPLPTRKVWSNKQQQWE